MRAARITGGIFAVLLVTGIVLTYVSNRAPARNNSAAPDALRTYRNDILGFTLAYNSSLISPEENFSITPIAQPWFCKPSDKLAAEYLSSVPVHGESCRAAPFLESVNFSAPRGVQTAVQSASHTNAIIIRSQTPVTNASTGKTSMSNSYRIFAEAPQGANVWALDFYLVPRKGILLCGDGTCDIGEE